MKNPDILTERCPSGNLDVTIQNMFPATPHSVRTAPHLTLAHAIALAHSKKTRESVSDLDKFAKRVTVTAFSRDSRSISVTVV